MQAGRVLEPEAKRPDPAAVRGSDVAEAPVLQGCDFQSLLCRVRWIQSFREQHLHAVLFCVIRDFGVVVPGCCSLILFLRVFLASLGISLGQRNSSCQKGKQQTSIKFCPVHPVLQDVLVSARAPESIF